MPRDGGGGGHHRADQMRAAVLALAPLEVAVRGAGAAFVRRQHVRVHANAHAAARIAPLKAGGGKNLVETFFFSLRLDPARAGHDESLLSVFRYVLPAHDSRGGVKT